jgi:hypothetical protein
LDSVHLQHAVNIYDHQKQRDILENSVQIAQLEKKVKKSEKKEPDTVDLTIQVDKKVEALES